MESLLYFTVETGFIVFVYLFVICLALQMPRRLTEVFVPSGSELHLGTSPILFVVLTHAVISRTRRFN